MPKQKGSIDLKTSGYLYGQISSLESQVDGQIQTWAQDTNPASNWSADEKANRVGDLWLFTGVSDNTTIQQGLTLHPQGIYKYVYDSANSIYKWEAHSSTNNNIFDLADGKKRVFYGTTLPSTPYDLNDVWVQGENGDIKVCRTARSSGSGANSDWVLASKYTNDDVFIAFRDGTYAQFVTNTNATLNKKITTFYQSSTPTANATGDLWINTTDNNNQLKRWNGSTWVDVQDKGIQDALTAASNAQSTADSKIITYAQASPPGPPSVPSLDIGDLWIDTDANNKLYRWNGAAWSPCTDTSELETWINGDFSTIIDGLEEGIVDAQIETWYQGTDPDDWSTSEKPKHEGDLWYNTTNGTTWYYAKKTTNPDTYGWSQQNIPDSVFDDIDGKAIIFTGTQTPSNAREGDLWFKGVNEPILTYVNNQWVQYNKYTDDSSLNAFKTGDYARFVSNTNSTLSQKITTFYDSQTPTANVVGDLWIDTGHNNILKRWNGNSWEEVQDTNIQTALINASNAQSTADKKIMTYINTYANRPTTNLDTGDLFIATDQNNKMYRWSGSTWVSVTDSSALNAFQTGEYARFVQNTSDAIESKITTFYETSQPTASATGDLWIDTDDGNKLYRWNGSSWVAIQDTAIQTALANAADAQSTADRKIVTFAQDNEPTATDTGDLWIDTNDNNKLYRWSGSSWLPFTDTSALEAFKTIYNADKSNILDQLDKKAETWYQSSNPANNWVGHESEHEGDLWYDTDDGTTWYYAKQGTNPETYDWEQQNIPTSIFNTINGKSSIYISQPSSYKAGDLWVNATYPSTEPYTYQNDILRCTTTSNSFNISHWTLASNYIDNTDATSIANGAANAAAQKVKTKTQYALSSNDSTTPSASSFSDTMPEVSSFISGSNRQYLWVRECMSYDNGSTWSASTPYKANTFNGLTLFTNSVKGNDYTSINGSTIKTGIIQSQNDGNKNFIRLSDGHLEFKDTSSWDNANQGIQWNSSQGQLNIKGHITAKSLTIDGAGGSYNAYDAINISGYSIEITMNDEGSSNTNPANNVWLYPHLYHNGVEVFYVLTSDTRAQSGKTYYYYNSTTSSYVAYSTAPQNPQADRAYEYINYTKFHWYLNGSTSTYSIGDINHYGRLLVLFTDKIKVTYTFDDGASDGGMTAMEVTVDDSKYIQRLDSYSINIHPENTSGNSITLNSSGVNLASGKYLINGSDWAVALSDKYTRSSAGDLNWSSTTEGDAKVIAKSALAFWNGAYSGTSSNLSKCSTGNIIGSNGGTMTGQLKTSFKQSVAMGSYGSSQTTIEGLAGEVRYSSGCSGSANIGTAYTLGGVTIPTGWYNFSWMPHRSGGVNGASSGDNCNYGNLLLFGMNNTNGRFIIRVSSSEVQEVVRLVTTAEFADYVTTQGSDTNDWKWRVWYSGRIEAWCTHTWTNVACTTSAGGGYRSGDVTLALPTGLFSTVESCQATMHGSGGSGYAMALRTLSSNTTSISQMFWNTVSATKTTCIVDYYVTGI